MCSLDMTENQNWISVGFSSRFSVIFSIELGPRGSNRLDRYLIWAELNWFLPRNSNSQWLILRNQSTSKMQCRFVRKRNATDADAQRAVTELERNWGIWYNKSLFNVKTCGTIWSWPYYLVVHSCVDNSSQYKCEARLCDITFLRAADMLLLG